MDRFAGITAKFDGRILKRGFWLYVWEISNGERVVLYVGRTGDSSSTNAASPFTRLSRHLDFRANAKGNAILRHMNKAKLDPSQCSFELFAMGPLFLEQHDDKSHDERRDKVAALECALAEHLRTSGYEILGSHACNKALDRGLYRRMVSAVSVRFPKRAMARSEN